jgi:hypothetical protein
MARQGQENYARNPYRLAVCADPWCGETFTTQNPQQLYCDSRCASRVAFRAYYERNRDRLVEIRAERRRRTGV